jgi:hypothetical protein
MDEVIQPEIIGDPFPGSVPAVSGIADDETMGDLHGVAAHELKRLMTYGNVRTKLAAISLTVKFLKDNHILTTVKKGGKNPGSKALDALPSVEELERLMRLTPHQDN